jgi:hypothetical protein
MDPRINKQIDIEAQVKSLVKRLLPTVVEAAETLGILAEASWIDSDSLFEVYCGLKHVVDEIDKTHLFANHEDETYSQAVLEEAFDKVKNPVDWKAPIDAVIASSEVALVRAAVLHFTATDIHLLSEESEISGGMVHIVADGYRMGPAGDF